MVNEPASTDQTTRTLSELPGPGLLDFLKIFFLDGVRDPIKILSRLQVDYGSVVRLRFPDFGGQVLLLSDPEMMEQVLLKQQKHFEKPDSAATKDVEEIMGQGLLTTDGEAWRRQHRVLMPHFQENSVDSMIPIAHEETERLLDRWTSSDFNQPFELFPEMKRVGLRFISRALFGYDMTTQEVREIRESIDTLRSVYRHRRTSLITFPLWVPTSRNQSAHDARDRLHELADRLINNYRDGSLETDTMLATIVEACYGGGEQKLYPEEVRAEIVTFIIAGYTTTAAAMGWMAYQLMNNPKKEKKLRDESEKAWAEHKPESIPNAIPYTRAAFDETLRIYPTAPWIARSSKKELTIDGLNLPAGTPVIMTPYLMHHNDEYHDQPGEFHPERFTGDTTPEPMTYIPFSVGAHQCIGREIALMEGPMIMSRIYSQGKLEPTPSTPNSATIHTAVNIEPEESIPVQFKPA